MPLAIARIYGTSSVRKQALMQGSKDVSVYFGRIRPIQVRIDTSYQRTCTLQYGLSVNKRENLRRQFLRVTSY